jgi:hypothetical protein
VGIPASYYIGCAAWYGPQGGLHAWVEIYYPDAGWIVSEPQTSANYLHAAGYVMGLLGVCGQSNTTVTQTGITYENQRLISLETPYTNQNSFGLNVASVPGMERRSVAVSPTALSASVSQAAPTGKVSLQVRSLQCGGEDWRVQPNVSWLAPTSVQGLSAGTATLDVRAEGLAPGRYQGSVTAYPSIFGGEFSVSVPVELWVTKLSVTGGGPWLYEYGVVGTEALPRGWPSLNTTPRALGDVNGDGKLDVVGFGQDGVYVALSTGAGLSAPQLWVRSYGTNAGGWTDQNTFPRMLGDVNGDGRADIVAFGNKATYVSLSTGTGFAAPASWISGYGVEAGGWTSQDLYPRVLGDVNGDGRADIVAFGNKATYVSLSSGTRFNAPVSWISGYGVQAGGWTSQDVFPRTVADVNGDGRADIVAFGNRATYVSFSTGAGFGPAMTWISAYGPSAGGWTSQTAFPRLLADINGDGRADIVAFGNTSMFVSLSSGSSFAAPAQWLRSYGPSAGGWSDQETYPRLAGDVTGDGKADVVGMGHVATFVSASNW